MAQVDKKASQTWAKDSVVRTFNTVSTVPNAKNPFVKPNGNTHPVPAGNTDQKK